MFLLVRAGQGADYTLPVRSADFIVCAAGAHCQAQKMYLRIAPQPVYNVAMAKKNIAPKVSNSEISRVMAAMGRKGGTATAKKLTAEQRKVSARLAAQARWGKKR